MRLEGGRIFRKIRDERRAEGDLLLKCGEDRHEGAENGRMPLVSRPSGGREVRAELGEGGLLPNKTGYGSSEGNEIESA